MMIETGYDCRGRMVVVQQRDAAAMLELEARDRFPEVFATSRMIALMELAAARAMHPLLQPGQLSVGVGLEVRHTAATQEGGSVWCAAAPRFLRYEGPVHALQSGGVRPRLA